MDRETLDVSEPVAASGLPEAAIRIRVNNRVIDLAEIDREVQYHPAGSLVDARRRAAQALTIRELLLAEASRQGIVDGGSGKTEAADEALDEARIRILIDRFVVVPEPTEANCRRYYDSNPDRMRTADRHEVSHILIPAPPDDAEIRATARKVAMELSAILRQEPQRFLELAREKSSCPSREDGGYLGMIGRGQTAPEFEKALSRLATGIVPEYPVETRYGFHVVLIHARFAGEQLSFENCRERIAEYLHEHVRRRAISQYIRLLAADHDIEGIDLDAATNPLVQ
ncbi:MAG: peptidylprolyl isomerase [Gammaproteobacteria bacterium]